MSFLAALLHGVAALLHPHAAAQACPPPPAGAPSLTAQVRHAQAASGGYAVALRVDCRNGPGSVEVDTVAPGRLAEVRLARADGTLLDLRWQGAWQRWLHGDEMAVARGRERPPLDLVQALRRASSHGRVAAARLHRRNGRYGWSFIFVQGGRVVAGRVPAQAGSTWVSGGPRAAAGTGGHSN